MVARASGDLALIPDDKHHHGIFVSMVSQDGRAGSHQLRYVCCTTKREGSGVPLRATCMVEEDIWGQYVHFPPLTICGGVNVRFVTGSPMNMRVRYTFVCSGRVEQHTRAGNTRERRENTTFLVDKTTLPASNNIFWWGSCSCLECVVKSRDKAPLYAFRSTKYHHWLSGLWISCVRQTLFERGVVSQVDSGPIAFSSKNGLFGTCTGFYDAPFPTELCCRVGTPGALEQGDWKTLAPHARNSREGYSFGHVCDVSCETGESPEYTGFSL